jgi:hypothetical protein
VNYDVQPLAGDANVFKGFCYAFDQFFLLLFSSSLPHLNDYDWHDITSASLLNG